MFEQPYEKQPPGVKKYIGINTRSFLKAALLGNTPPVTNHRMLLSSCVLYIFNLDLIINQLCASAFKKANVDTLSLDNLVSSTESII